MVETGGLKRWAQPILVPAIVFVAVALVLGVVTRQIISLQDEVRHTQVVKDHLTSLMNLLQESETAVRGYLLTGSDEILQPYKDARDAVPKALTDLKSLTVDNPVQQKKRCRSQSIGGGAHR